MHQLAVAAGTAAAALFMISQLPMLIKAGRTKDLASYSLANLALANLGNVLYAFYVVHVPLGPVWAIHGFNLTTSGLMLFWYLRHGPAQGAADPFRVRLDLARVVAGPRPEEPAESVTLGPRHDVEVQVRH